MSRWSLNARNPAFPEHSGAGCAVRKDIAKVPEIEQVIAVGAAVENLLLAANDWLWRDVEDRTRCLQCQIKAVVGLAADDHIVAILHLGTKVK